jgi:two-component system, NarL family, invasion response regulator UvrY
MNILVVEDHPIVREVLVAVARYALKGAQVQAVGSLEAALEAARAMPMGAVLLDLGLPGCEGVDSVRRFKAAFPGVVIVVVSSNEDSQVIAAALEAGASGYLPKGLTPAGLTRALAGTRLGQQPEWLVPELSRSLNAAVLEPKQRQAREAQ